MLASAQASSARPPGLDLRPLRAAEPVRPPSAERRGRAESAPRAEAAAPARAAPAVGYGRPAARFVAAGPAPAAFLAQLIAQQDEAAEVAPQRRAEGVAAYRRAAGDNLQVIGPAGLPGVLL